MQLYLSVHFSVLGRWVGIQIISGTTGRTADIKSSRIDAPCEDVVEFENSFGSHNIRFYWVQSDLTSLIIIGLTLIILLRLDFAFIVSARLA